MSILVDTNILVYGINDQAPQHLAARRFVEELRGGSGFCVTWSILYELMRITTHPQVFPRPLKPKQAADVVRQLVGDPRVDILCETARHADVLEQVLADAPPLRGNRYHDAHIATLMLEHGLSRIATADRHFRVFQFLKIVDPT